MVEGVLPCLNQNAIQRSEEEGGRRRRKSPVKNENTTTAFPLCRTRVRHETVEKVIAIDNGLHEKLRNERIGIVWETLLGIWFALPATARGTAKGSGAAQRAAERAAELATSPASCGEG